MSAIGTSQTFAATKTRSSSLLFRRVEDHEVRKRLRPLCRPEICFVEFRLHQSSPGRGLEPEHGRSCALTVTSVPLRDAR